MDFLHSSYPGLKRSLVWFVLHTNPIRDKFMFIPHILVHFPRPFCETVLLGYEDLLSSRELELGTSESLYDVVEMGISPSHRHDRLAYVNPGNRPLGLTPGSPHTCLEPISSSTRQHLVDPDHVVGMNSHSHMEGFLTTELN